MPGSAGRRHFGMPSIPRFRKKRDALPFSVPFSVATLIGAFNFFDLAVGGEWGWQSAR